MKFCLGFPRRVKQVSVRATVITLSISPKPNCYQLNFQNVLFLSIYYGSIICPLVPYGYVAITYEYYAYTFTKFCG